MKLSFRTILVICSILTGAFFQARCSDDSAQSTDNLLDVVEKAQKTIYQKYPDESSIARKMAIEELEKIARSDKTEDERIAAILAKYPDPATKLRQAAEQGDAEAQFNLGLCYEKGNGEKKDVNEAFNWYRKAAGQGFAKAENRLAICYHNGKGVNKNYAESVKWFRRAAEQGLATAAINLFICYNEKESASLPRRNQGQAEAVEFLRQAAERGDSMAQLELGFLFSLLSFCYVDDGTLSRPLVDFPGIPYFSEPVKWFRRAAVQDNAFAQLSLAACLICTEFPDVLKDNIIFSDNNPKKFSPEIGQWFSKFIHHEPAELKKNFGGLVFEEELRVEDWAVLRFFICGFIQLGINEFGSYSRESDIKEIHDLAAKITGADDASVEATLDVLLQKTNGSSDADVITPLVLKIPRMLFGIELGQTLSEQEATQNISKLMDVYLKNLLGRQIRVLAGLTMLKSTVIPQGERIFFTIAKKGSGAAFIKWDETNREFVTVGETDETEFPYIVINSPEAAARVSNPKEIIIFCEDPADFSDGIFFAFGDGSVKFLEGDFDNHVQAINAAIKAFGITEKASADILKKAAAIDAIFVD